MAAVTQFIDPHPARRHTRIVLSGSLREGTMLAAYFQKQTNLLFGLIFVGMLVWMFGAQTNAPLKPSSTVPEISIGDAFAAITRGAVVIDVRERDAYEKGHIEGAVSVPLEELKRRAAEFAAQKEKEYVIYCGNGSNLGPQGTRVLVDAGHPAAKNLTAGLSGWKAAGQPVASGPK
jgi:rhodanese-related sulfurtransferase